MGSACSKIFSQMQDLKHHASGTLQHEVLSQHRNNGTHAHVDADACCCAQVEFPTTSLQSVQGVRASSRACAACVNHSTGVAVYHMLLFS